MPQEADRPRTKRARPSTYNSTACDQCFRRKIRCNSKRPVCGSCSLSGSICTFSNSKAGSNVGARSHNNHSPRRGSTWSSTTVSSVVATDDVRAGTLQQSTPPSTSDDSRSPPPAISDHGNSQSMSVEQMESGNMFPGFAPIDNASAFNNVHRQSDVLLQGVNNNLANDLDPLAMLPDTWNSIPLPAKAYDYFSPQFCLDGALQPTTIPTPPRRSSLTPPPMPRVSRQESSSSSGDEGSSEVICKLYECSADVISHPTDITLMYAGAGIELVRSRLYDLQRSMEAPKGDSLPAKVPPAVKLLACVGIMRQVISIYVGLHIGHFMPSCGFGVDGLDKNVLEVVILGGLRQCRELTSRLESWCDTLSPDMVAEVAPFVSSLRWVMDSNTICAS